MKKRRLLEALERLKAEYGEVACALNFENPYQLLVATMLSAQCTDARVNMVTPAFFEKLPTPEILAKAKAQSVEKVIRSTGFFRNKAKNLVAMAKALVKDHAGQVPRTLKELEALPGVGRKTANVVLGNAFGIASGIAIDTHVLRLMDLMGIAESANPEKLEAQLKTLIPKDDWIDFTHYFITHGRRVCIARRPRCRECVLSDLCPVGQQEAK